MKKLLLVVIIVLLTIPSASLADEDKVKLLIPVASDVEDRGSNRVALRMQNTEGDKQVYKETDLDTFVNKFKNKGYKVDQIEVWVEGVASTSGVTKLVLSLEGKGGMKVILKPQDN